MNLYQCPPVAYSGTKDSQKQAADVMEQDGLLTKLITVVASPAPQDYFLRHRHLYAAGQSIVALMVAASFGARAFPYRSRPFAPLALAGPPLAAIVLVIGLGTLKSSAPLRSAVQAEAPVLACALCLTGAASGADRPPEASH